MADFETLYRRVWANLQQEGIRYNLVATTSAGAAGGTTVISTNLTENDDFWNGAICLYNNEYHTVEDFANATGTLTFTNNPFSVQVPTSATIELFEPGTWRADDIKRFILEAAETFLRIAPFHLLHNYKKIIATAGLSGVVDLPANVLTTRQDRFYIGVSPNGGIAADIVPMTLISIKRRRLFNDGAFSDTDKYIGYLEGREDSDDVGRLRYSPANNKDIIFEYIPVPSFDSNNDWKVPEELWAPIIFGATQLALAANERIDLAKHWEKEMIRVA